MQRKFEGRLGTVIASNAAARRILNGERVLLLEQVWACSFNGIWIDQYTGERRTAAGLSPRLALISPLGGGWVLVAPGVGNVLSTLEYDAPDGSGDIGNWWQNIAFARSSECADCGCACSSYADDTDGCGCEDCDSCDCGEAW